MASKNTLLGSGKIEVDEEQPILDEVFDPMWLYHTNFPEGKIVRSIKEKAVAIEEGWVDHPGKCTLLPGFEQLYEGKENTGCTVTVGTKEKTGKK